ncbi:MAG: lytic transglycosylase domain-containing protein [Bacteroidales bacterium]|nr:lytic transglycosylase domain-containing protein [Bacteroidales bacterium]
MKKILPTIIKTGSVLAGLLIIWVVINLFNYSYVISPEDQPHQDEFNLKYSVFSLNIPEKVDFAGEEMPIQYFDVMESLDRELLVNTYWQSQTLMFFKRANKYFPIIEPILEKNNIPADFKYLALAESGLMNVVSPAGASGFWQFMKATGLEYGLEINNEVDERYNLILATEAACKLLNDAYKKYESWSLVAASYNMGMGGLDKQLKQQKVNDYYDLHLNSETARYVYRIVAIKLIMDNPKLFSFHFREKDLYQMPITEEIVVDSTITDWADFALEHNTNYKILRELNPWIRGLSLTNKNKKQYSVTIPKKGYRDLRKND